jgi:protein-S-isoprenylcysteine O-methyltransferase Ste14
MSWALYAALVVTLVVRVRSAEAPIPEPARPLAGEPLWLTAAHHTLLAGILVGAPLERLILGGAGVGRLAGACLFAGGIVLYRLGGRALGDALTPFTEPRAGAPLVVTGLYRRLRHPMYFGQALIAVGAPLTLGARYLLLLSGLDVLVLGARILREEEALARTFPEYPRYAARTKRLIPFLY